MSLPKARKKYLDSSAEEFKRKKEVYEKAKRKGSSPTSLISGRHTDIIHEKPLGSKGGG